MGAFLVLVNALRYCYGLKGQGTALLWLILSLSYLCYLHGACVGFILSISWINYSIVKLFARYKYCTGFIWTFNLSVLILNRVYEGYSFSLFWHKLAFLDNYRGTFRWLICFNFAAKAA
ncbi:membrane-bound O-acyltransferase gup1-like [Phragmites australis]|uniref:membrane-bound O-acyltransferase gup1-like n=1 Tax=Phragmites australis TaxID=29695 RepID=UPI002D7A3168|nr:membrane-bound O-acyltransferase gup1-like [Phragmites australis]